jgi:predicted amidohydrolase
MALQGYADFAFGLGSPEMAEQKQYYFREAEPIPGPSTERIAEAARRHGMFVQFGLAEAALHGNVIFNSVALVGPEGLIGVYRKVHNHFEFPYFAPGEDTSVFRTPFATIGSLICYDVCFPELVRAHCLQGASLILMSTAWPMKGHDRSEDYHGWAMDLAAQSNCFFNQCWMIVSDHCETGAYSQGVDYWGGSQIIDPHGKVVGYLGREEGLVVHCADLADQVLRSRTSGFCGLNLLQDRRPEHYGAVTAAAYRRAPRGAE